MLTVPVDATRAVVQCVHRHAVVVRVVRSRAPELSVPLKSLTARASRKKKQHVATASAALHNAHGAVIDLDAAPCQPSAAYGRLTLPAFEEGSR